MPRVVRGPDGVLQRFPDDATDAQISAALKAIPQTNAETAPKAPTWSDHIGLNEPTASPMTGFLRGAGAGIVDMAQGAVANVTGQMNDKLKSENAVRRDAGMRQTATMPQPERPDTFAGSVGYALPTIAEMAAPVGVGAKVAAEVLPSTARAGQNFQKVMAAAKDIPLDLSAPGQAALRIMDLAERGGAMPKAVRDFLRIATDPNKQTMTYEVGRDLASNISRLSADEMGRLTPVMAREVANLRVVLNKSLAQAAKQAGKLDEYQSAMREYANAMRVRNVVDSAIAGAKKSAPYASVAGAGYWLSKKFADLIN